jgi:hypothetical protein
VRPATSYSPQGDRGEERVGVGGTRVFGLLLAGTLALFCLGISLSFVASALATNAAAATTEVCCAPMGKATGDADGETLVRLDNDATSGLLTTPGDEVREGEELSGRISVLTSMLVLAASPFFTSGLVLLASNASLMGGAHHCLVGVLPGGWSAAVGGRASLLGVFLL